MPKVIDIFSRPVYSGRKVDICVWEDRDGRCYIVERVYTPWSFFKSVTYSYIIGEGLSHAAAKKMRGRFKADIVGDNYCDENNPTFHLVFDNFESCVACLEKAEGFVLNPNPDASTLPPTEPVKHFSETRQGVAEMKFKQERWSKISKYVPTQKAVP